MMSQYMSDEEINKIFSKLDLLEDLDPSDIAEYVVEAEADLHRGVAERYEIPLRYEGGPFSSAPEFTQITVRSAMKALIRKVIASDHFKSNDENETQDYMKVHYAKSQRYIKDLLSNKIDYKLKLAAHAPEFKPIQTIGIARSDY